MYWKLDSFDHARREFPRFRDLHDETRDVYWGAHADHDIDWDYFESACTTFAGVRHSKEGAGRHN